MKKQIWGLMLLTGLIISACASVEVLDRTQKTATIRATAKNRFKARKAAAQKARAIFPRHRLVGKPQYRPSPDGKKVRCVIIVEREGFAADQQRDTGGF